MAIDAGLESVTTASPAGRRRSAYGFEAVRPGVVGPGSARNAQISISRADRVAAIYVDGQCLVRVPRSSWRAWLEGSRFTFTYGALIMRRSNLGVWFEVAGAVAPSVLTREAQASILELLAD